MFHLIFTELSCPCLHSVLRGKLLADLRTQLLRSSIGQTLQGSFLAVKFFTIRPSNYRVVHTVDSR